MFNFIGNYKKDITRKTLTAFILIMVVTSLVLVVGSTYAADSYTIVFNRAEGNEIMKTCYTDANGKLDEDCISTISGVCSRWSHDVYYGTPQSNQIGVSDLADMTFSKNNNYYCVGGTSGNYNMGCYVCKTDHTIMHWSSNGNANNNCTAGYTKSTTIINENECVTVVPDSCYVCKTDSNIMKWKNNNKSDSDCSSGYDPIDKDINQCKTVVQDACYVCKNNKNVMKWNNDGNADNNCSSGYTVTDISKNECIIRDNPQTNDIMIFGVWVIGFITICYSLYYYKKIKKA